MNKSVTKKKSWVKKLFIGLGISFILLLAAMIILPIMYKDEIKNLALKEVNKMLLADVDVKEFDLTIISTFPNLTAQFDSVTVTGRDTFDKVELVNLERLKVHLDFWSLFGDKFEIKGFSLIKPRIDVRILKNGVANYDIMKPDSLKTPEEEEPSAFKLSLKHYEIEEGQVRYDDRSSNMFVDLVNLNHTGSGDLTADIIDFDTKTTIDGLTFKMDGMKYLSKVKTDLVANILMEFTEKSSKFTLRENTLALNNFKLSVDGFYEMLENKSNMDLKLNTSKSTFKDLLSLIPTFYRTGYENMITNGSLALNAAIKGILDDKDYPSWNVGLKVSNASIKYPDLPEQLKNIQIDAKSTFPGGSNLNKMTADVDKFHVEFVKNTVDASLKLRNIMTDPAIDTKIKAFVDLATLGKVIPLVEGESYNGLLNADIALKGNMSSIDKGRYEEFNALGTLELKDMIYQSPDLPKSVNISEMLFKFTPRNLNLVAFKGKTGNSDFNVNGTIDNYLEYMFKDEKLKGDFRFSSNFLDLDELMGYAPTSTEEAPVEPNPNSTEEAITIPANIDFNLNANIEKLRYTGLDITNVTGNVGLKDETAYLNNVQMDAMGGKVGLSGKYNTSNPYQPSVDFAYSLKQIDIQTLAKTFVTTTKFAPILKYVKGDVSSNLTLNTKVTPDFSPILSTVNSLGDFSATSVTISGFEPLAKIGNALKMDKLGASQNLKNIVAYFKIADGKLMLQKPMNLKIGNITTETEGWTALDQTIGYVMKMNIPKEDIPQVLLKNIEKGLDKINGLVPQLKLADLPAFIPVNVNIGGTTTSPKITTDIENSIKNLTGNLKNNVKDAAKEVVTKVKDSVKTVVTEKVKEVKEDVSARIQKEKQQILDQGQKQANALKAEGKKQADNVRLEGDKAAQKLIDEAGGNPLKKKAAEIAAKKLRDEANSKANKIESEANSKADGIMNTAREKADAVK
jgi:hypothetical protein